MELAIEDRELCPDGTCIGVIGSDGRCGECGRAASGELPSAIATAGAGELVEIDESDDDFANRKLCSDPLCVGVVGDSGRCKDCGKPSLQ